jgi:uncharacterized protein
MMIVVDGAVDAWVNPNFGPPADQSMSVGYLFPGLQERWERGTTLDQLVDEMDEAGVAHAVLCANYGGQDDLDWVTTAIEKHPRRFAGSIVVEPKEGMAAVRLIDRAVRDLGFTMVRVLAFETQLPYDDAAYFPVYAKCAELRVPIGVNVGIPGPLVPGKHQHPLALDEICHFFPELTVVMSHGGEPWADLCVKLMLKWPNLHYMTSAFAPKHLPPEILRYLNTRGSDKIMWASDYPLLSLRRCVDEIAALPLRSEETRRKFYRDNALRMFGFADR